jgi:hypothetical protein
MQLLVASLLLLTPSFSWRLAVCRAFANRFIQRFPVGQRRSTRWGKPLNEAVDTRFSRFHTSLKRGVNESGRRSQMAFRHEQEEKDRTEVRRGSTRLSHGVTFWRADAAFQHADWACISVFQLLVSLLSPVQLHRLGFSGVWKCPRLVPTASFSGF